MSKHTMKHVLQMICLAVGLLLPATPAAPQSTAPDALTAARELVTAMRVEDQMKAIMPAVFRSMKNSLVRGSPSLERDFDDAMPMIMSAMNARMSDFVDLMATIYARNFNVAELEELTVFYRSAIGQKMVDRMQYIAQDALAAGQEFGQQVASELQTRMVEELRKKGHDL